MKEIVIGIDIGGTTTKFGLIEKDGNILTKGTHPTNDYDDAEAFVDALYVKISGLLKSLDGNFDIKGIGIGAPNGNYFKGTIEYAPNLKWKGVVNLAKLFAKHTALPVFVTNDANAAAIGEMIYGGAKGMRNFIMITLGTGLGSGFVINGRVVYGHDGLAGELGHTIIFPEGRLCGCGRKGCLETYASATGFKQTVIEHLKNTDEKSTLRNYKPEEISASLVDKEAAKGDKLALEAFEFTAKILGMRLADAVAITNPEAIFLFGGLAKAGDLLFKPVKKYMEYYLLNVFKNKIKLFPSQLPDADAAILGAGALVWNELAGVKH